MGDMEMRANLRQPAAHESAHLAQQNALPRALTRAQLLFRVAALLSLPLSIYTFISGL